MIEFLTELSKLAGQRAMHYFGKISSSDIECKAAKDLVSVADKAVEELIISKISETFPTHDIFGEETAREIERVICISSSASLYILSTTPQVDTEIWR